MCWTHFVKVSEIFLAAKRQSPERNISSKEKRSKRVQQISLKIGQWDFSAVDDGKQKKSYSHRCSKEQFDLVRKEEKGFFGGLQQRRIRQFLHRVSSSVFFIVRRLLLSAAILAISKINDISQTSFRFGHKRIDLKKKSFSLWT